MSDGGREPAKVLGMSEIVDDCRVVTVTSSKDTGRGYRRSPCVERDGEPSCPWLVDSPVGAFPAAVYRHSANTAYDASLHQFGCHNSSKDYPLTCAGFLLRGSAHNLATRFTMRNEPEDAVHDGGFELYDSYRAMAIANGVDPGDPSLAPCRDNTYDYPLPHATMHDAAATTEDTHHEQQPD